MFDKTSIAFSFIHFCKVILTDYGAKVMKKSLSTQFIHRIFVILDAFFLNL